MSERIAVTPEDVLPDGQDHAEAGGTVVRKGSVGAFLANARAWEALPGDDPAAEELLDQMRALLPALRAIGLLEIFAVRSTRLAAALGES